MVYKNQFNQSCVQSSVINQIVNSPNHDKNKAQSPKETIIEQLATTITIPNQIPTISDTEFELEVGSTSVLNEESEKSLKDNTGAAAIFLYSDETHC